MIAVSGLTTGRNRLMRLYAGHAGSGAHCGNVHDVFSKNK
jgi:hypothetical protein